MDPGDQDLLGFLLEESGDLGAVPNEAMEAPVNWELPLSQVGGNCGAGARCSQGRGW